MEDAIWNDISKAFEGEKEILDFCEDMKIISEIEYDDDSDTIRSSEQVHAAVERLIGYVENSKSANPAVNDMFGFALTRKNRSDRGWKEYLDDISTGSRKQYLFFLADMKIKATVYYLRIHNFITNCPVTRDGNDAVLLDNKYYLFDNSMREFLFTGIGWKRLWRYEKSEADLFRCSNPDRGDTFSYPDALYLSGRVFYQKMIKNIVDHMNKGNHPEGDRSAKLASYSKNPFRDIYKYLLIDSTSSYEFKADYDKETRKASALLVTKNDTGGFRCGKKRFSMAKNAITNCIVDISKDAGENSGKKMILNGQEVVYRTGGNPRSFTEFIAGEESDGEHIFCVDILNDSVETSGDIRTVFQQYTAQFPEVDVKGLARVIVSADDEEVVMLGNTCDEIHDITEENCSDFTGYDDFLDNHEYRIELTGEDILQLFAYIRYEIMGKGEPDKEVIRYQSEHYMQIMIGQKSFHCEIQEPEYDKITDKELAAREKELLAEAVRNAVYDAIKRECEPSETCNGLRMWNRKVRTIGLFLKEYHDKNVSFGFGESIYKIGTDDFINTCRELYLR